MVGPGFLDARIANGHGLSAVPSAVAIVVVKCAQRASVAVMDDHR